MSFSFTQKRLKGGLQVALFPRNEMQSVTFVILIGVGSRYETKSQSGLSHFLEHMFFKGTRNLPKPQHIAQALDDIGAEYNAFTGEEYTGFYVKTARENLSRGVEVVADILLNSQFLEQEIEKERGVIIEEIRMYTDSPMKHVSHLWQEAMFGKHSLGRRIDGSIKTVSSFSRKDFIAYTGKHYHTGNAIIAVAGACQTHEVSTRIQKLFAGLPVGRETYPTQAPRRIPEKRVVFERRTNLDQTHLIVGGPGLSLRDKRRWAAEVLAIILGGGMSSRLFVRVREEHGLAYSIHTSLSSYTDTGSFETQAGLRTDRAEFGLSLICSEYDKACKNLVSEDELARAKEIFRGHFIRNLEESNALAFYGASQLLLEKQFLTPAKVWDAIRSVSRKDVRSVARVLLDPRKRALALLSSHKSPKAFEKALI